MKIYYFIHLTGRNAGNSGIQRVVRNLGSALQARGDVELLAVRWDEERGVIVHAEYKFQQLIALFNGPVFIGDDREGMPIHLSTELCAGEAETSEPGGASPTVGSDGNWVLIPEAPHLGSHDADYPSVHLSDILGYVRRYGFRSAVVFHDILPISHFGLAASDAPEALKFVIYANALSFADVIFPVSRASAQELVNWFARTGVTRDADRLIQPVLLPEEMVGIDQGRHLEGAADNKIIEFCMWGSVHTHKNQAFVLEAFNRLCEQRYDLDLHMHLFGHIDGRLAERVAQALRRSNGRIHIHGFVDDKKMASIVARCRASVFLSLAEGYGLPLAESLWLGKPCLTSNLAPMTEIAEGGGCLLADPTDRSDIASALALLATNDELLRTLRDELVARRFRRWSDYADDIIRALVERPRVPLAEIYPAKPSTRPPILLRSRIIKASDLSISETYRHGPNELLRDRSIEYNYAVHGSESEQILTYGPYIDVSRGFHSLHLGGMLRGEAVLLLTLRAGKSIIGEWRINDGLDPIEFELAQDGKQFEMVLKKLENTRYLFLTHAILEEYTSSH